MNILITKLQKLKDDLQANFLTDITSSLDKDKINLLVLFAQSFNDIEASDLEFFVFVSFFDANKLETYEAAIVG